VWGREEGSGKKRGDEEWERVRIKVDRTGDRVLPADRIEGGGQALRNYGRRLNKKYGEHDIITCQLQ